MSLQYGCQVSNRYIGYLDSSDYGHSTDFDGKPEYKRKTKKKRKPKYRKYANKAVNTDDFIESVENSDEETDAHFASDEAEAAHSIDKEKTFETNDSSNAAIASDAMTQTNTSIDSGKCTESTNDGQSSASDSKFIKWSVICFEEEKSMQEIKNQAPVLEKRKVYPTMFFYNSNYRGYHPLPDRRHSSFHKMMKPDDAIVKRRLARRPSKRSPENDTD